MFTNFNLCMAATALAVTATRAVLLADCVRLCLQRMCSTELYTPAIEVLKVRRRAALLIISNFARSLHTVQLAYPAFRRAHADS